MDARETRFWALVARGATQECWPWCGATSPKGYGKFSTGPRRTRKFLRAHRFAWELSNGEIPQGMQVLHACDNPGCCNPRHLFLGTNDDNVRDKVSKGRQRNQHTAGRPLAPTAH